MREGRGERGAWHAVPGHRDAALDPGAGPAHPDQLAALAQRHRPGGRMEPMELLLQKPAPAHAVLLTNTFSCVVFPIITG